MRKFLYAVFMLIMMFLSTCKSANWTNVAGGELAILASSNSPFPHPQRATGHFNRDSLYSFEEHYNDSSVAIFIFPEGPRNAPDSFGGRLEEKDVFKALVEDVLTFLKHEKRIADDVPGRIILSGHSGAYRVISYILNRGGLTENISEVYLFDALYAQIENYTHWVEKHGGKLVNITTPNGGTNSNSVELVEDLNDWGIANLRIGGNEVSAEDLSATRITSVFTTLGHSEVIDPYFQICLSASGLKKSE